MLIDSNQIIPITRLQKELTKKVRELSASGEALYILKNNNMEAVMLSFEEYKYLHTLEEMFEQFEIQTMLAKRLKNYDQQNNIPWEDIKEDL